MVQLGELVRRAGAGDTEAFAELVRQYQDMAFGYALSVLGDFHLAQDAAQEAFVSAYFGLPSLREAEKFPGWLRGIVRHQCSRLLRKRPAAVLSLDVSDAASVLPDLTPGMEVRLEKREDEERLLAGIRALPQPLREVVVLYYFQEHPQREVASFLELPVTTVNNRLHAARQTLRGGLLTMAKQVIQTNELPDDFARKVGEIVGARGPLVEARFNPEHTPAVLTVLAGEERPPQGQATAGVVQHLGTGRVRCITLAPEQELSAGTRVISTDRPVQSVESQGVV